MRVKLFLSLLSFVFLMAGCKNASPSIAPTNVPANTPTLEFSLPIPATLVNPTASKTPSVEKLTLTPVSDQQNVLDLAFEVINVIKADDSVALSQYVHPQMGLRFSPYSYVKDSDQVFTTQQVAGLLDDSTVYLWGNYDGSGEPINLTFADYYAKFIYDVDFADAPQLSLNHRLSTGNSIDNSQEYYPGSMIVEFYFPGFDPQYGGMDWRSLRLVFMQDDGTWYLAGLIHDQWTT
ncbi:MAG: hypothetical protein C3F13_16965 [Anaerolineales bacterium]|nr:hypothetical protein [Anaerolineae bacterium]PWB50159.1 MAG: hypothetical protein C3F13_16965 [Anaerolineales bacterium]